MKTSDLTVKLQVYFTCRIKLLKKSVILVSLFKKDNF